MKTLAQRIRGRGRTEEAEEEAMGIWSNKDVEITDDNDNDSSGQHSPVPERYVEYPMVGGLSETSMAIKTVLTALADSVYLENADQALREATEAMELYVRAVEGIPSKKAVEVAVVLKTAVATVANTMTAITFDCEASGLHVGRVACYTSFSRAVDAMPKSCRSHVAKDLNRILHHVSYVVWIVPRPKRLAVSSALNTAFSELGEAIVGAPKKVQQEIVKEYLEYIGKVSEAVRSLAEKKLECARRGYRYRKGWNPEPKAM